MLTATAGQILVNEALPEGLRDYGRVLDKDGVKSLLRRVAEEHPEEYRGVSHRLASIGHRVAQESGGLTFSLRHLAKSRAGAAARGRIEEGLRAVLADDSLDDRERERRVLRLADAERDRQQREVYEESLKGRNPLAIQARSGARGSPMNVSSLRGSDLLYVDHRDRVIPIPITRSYAEGLTPWEWWAGAYGARKGVIDTKTATAKSGYFGKQLAQAAHRLVVTGVDADGDGEPDAPETLRGLPVDADDPHNEGALLARDTGPYPRNTALTPGVLSHLRRLGHDRLLVRSPAVGGSPEGGLYARDVGVREHGGLPGVGEQIGMLAANAVGEPTSQGMLCLAGGTLVRMADWSVRAIEDLRPGDLVLGADLTGKTSPVRVVRLFDNGPRRCHLYVGGPGETVLCSPDHKFLAEDPRGGLTLKPAAEAEWVYDHSAKAFVFLKDMGDKGERPTFDIEVDHHDHLFCIAGGFVVSNSSKHSGGVAGAARTVGGFQYVNNLIQGPRNFPGAASHAQLDGVVRSVEPAPAGGNIVRVGVKEHFVPPGVAVLVKPGDTVEAGDMLSEGAPHPAEAVRHKGIGEARRLFTHAFREGMKASGIAAHRRNVEVLARGLFNHVRLTDEYGGGAPGDVLPYASVERDYRPREGFKTVAPAKAVGLHLERPYLHYTVGTKVRPSVAKELERFGVGSVDAHDDPAPFEPHFVRAADNLQHDPDWMTRMYGAKLRKGLFDAAHRGATSDERGTSFVPGLARAVDFGRQGLVRTPKAAADLVKEANPGDAAVPSPGAKPAPPAAAGPPSLPLRQRPQPPRGGPRGEPRLCGDVERRATTSRP